MITGVHHLNFLVKDLSKSVEYLETLLQIKPVYDDLPSRQVKTARFKLGDTFIVLVCPQGEDGEPAQILAQRGEGLFLVSLTCLSIEETLERLSNKGIQAKSSMRRGLIDWSIIDLDTPPALGPILQLCQPGS